MDLNISCRVDFLDEKINLRQKVILKALKQVILTLRIQRH